MTVGAARFVLAATAALIIFIVYIFVADDKASLPAHVVSKNDPIPPKAGRVIHLTVSDQGLTRDECSRIIDAYRRDASPDGQVAVHKPPAPSGAAQPWCVENFDGAGVRFNF